MAQSREEKLAKQREYNKSEAGRASQARYMAKPENLERKRRQNREWQAANPEKGRAATRRYMGVVDPPGERRTGVCPICLKADRKLYLDHEHVTGVVRGWLCQSCNAFIGKTTEDAASRANRVLTYIKKAS